MRKIISLATLAMSLAVTGCNTVSGAGRGMKSAGEAVTSAAEDAKP